MTKKNNTLTLILLLLAFSVAAQNNNPCYTDNMSKGNNAFSQGKYSEAKDFFSTAKKCAGGSTSDVKKSIAACNTKIKEQKQTAKVVKKAKKRFKKSQYGKAFPMFRKTAEQGNDEAQLYLALMYFEGKGVVKDDNEAMKWLRKASEQDHGDTVMQRELGKMYAFLGDYGEAAKWFRKAADQGDAESQYSLGYMYFDGVGVNQDYSEAVKWYKKAAEQGHSDGQHDLGYMYEKGLGVKQDYKEAERLYREAAVQGLAKGQLRLGLLYFEGMGVDKDYKEAIKWFRKAAEQGNPSGQFILGNMYEEGFGVDKSPETAKEWYRKAANQGNERAMKALTRLGEKW